MGKVLSNYYDEAKKIGGLSAQIKLAILTKLPSVRAEAAADSPENIELFRHSFDIIKKEFKK